MEIVGESRVGVTLLVDTNNTAAFRNASATIVERVAIRNMTITAASGVTGARAYQQTDRSTYTSWAEFDCIETALDLKISYEGFFSFTRWLNCRDGYIGNAVGGQYHQAIYSVPATYGQSLQTNLNTCRDCQFFRFNDPTSGLLIAYGAQWRFEHTDFENGTVTAIGAYGIMSLAFSGCWFENIDSSYIVNAETSSSPNPQGVRVLSFDNCFVQCHASNTYVVGGSWASSASLCNIALANVPSGMKLAQTTTVVELYGIVALSGTPTNLLSNIVAARSGLLLSSVQMGSGTVNAPQTANQNVLPIGPGGLGQASFTVGGITAKSDVASGIGLAASAVQFTLSGSGNYAVYSLPAKMVTFLRGKTITLVMFGYSGTATVADGMIATVWDSISAAFGTGAVGSVEIDVSSTALQVAYVTVTVGASASSLGVGFQVGGANNTKTVLLETMAVYLGQIRPQGMSIR